MRTREALEKMNELALNQGFEITQGPVYGNYSSRSEDGVKVQSVTRTYEKRHTPTFWVGQDWQGDDVIIEGEPVTLSKLTLSYDAATDEIY